MNTTRVQKERPSSFLPKFKWPKKMFGDESTESFLAATD